jgi:MFS transporter, FHS family, L-fucose permease
MARNLRLFLLILLIFFIISFLTNILGPIIPDLIDSFRLNLTLAAFLPFSFFVSYGVMSIPAGMLIEKFHEKPVIAGAFLLSFAGAFWSALFPSYPVLIMSLFMIGTGMAMLQVALNPLVRVAGGEEHYAFNLVLVQLVFGLASYISPLVYSWLVTGLGSEASQDNYLLELLSRHVPPGLAWVSLYWIFALISLIMFVFLVILRLPSVQLKEEERVGAWGVIRSLFRNRTVVLFFIGTLAYTGSEQGIANWLSKFLAVYHGFDPHSTGAQAVSWFWGFFTAGTLLGLALLKLFDSRRVLIGFAVATMACLTLGLWGPARVALYALPFTGFFCSSMWCIVFSLGLNSLDRHHGAFSGILCTGIVGGALIPLAIGSLGDWFGLRNGMLFLYLTLGYLLSVGFWARPLVVNETIGSKKTGRPGKQE